MLKIVLKQDTQLHYKSFVTMKCTIFSETTHSALPIKRDISSKISMGNIL